MCNYQTNQTNGPMFHIEKPAGILQMGDLIRREKSEVSLAFSRPDTAL